MQGHGAAQPIPAPSAPPDGDVVRALRDDGSIDPAHDPRLDSADAVAIYRAMVRVRLLDERLVALQRQGRIGFHIGSQGEEAAIVGSAAALRDADWIFPCYREFGAALWRGMPLAAYVNHMFGNAADPIKGRQMPDHYGSRVARFASISSPVGTQITQAAGFAWAAKIKRDDVATLVYFGEGATSSGEFHNGLNFAGVFGVPLVLFCRNNAWAVVASSNQTAIASFAGKAVAYGISGVRVDGNDLFAVLKVTRDAIARAAAGGGPTMIEALTARMPPREGAADWRRRDPIARVRRYLEARGLWSDVKQREHEGWVLGEIDAAIEDAEKLGPPALPTLFDDVYGAPPAQQKEQRAELLAAPRPTGLAKPT